MVESEMSRTWKELRGKSRVVEAAFRLANRRLQPLGHLTVMRMLSIRRPLSYENTTVPKIVPATGDSSGPEQW